MERAISTRQAGLGLAAAAGTWLLGLTVAANGSGGLPGPLAGIVALAITAMWGAAWLLAAPRGLVIVAALLWAAAAALAPGGAGVALAPYVASGLLLGVALGRGWRADAVLALALVPVLALMVVAARQAPLELEAVFANLGRQMSEALQRAAQSGADARTVADFQAGLASALQLARRLWPALAALTALADTALVCWLVRWAVRRARGAASLRPWRPLPEWRLPFYMVWVLAAGLALFLTRRQPARDAGLNVIVAVGVLLSVQGLAIFAALSRRTLPPWAQALVALLGVMLFPPGVLAGGAVVGLMDQWVDFRRYVPPAGEGDPGSRP